MKVQNIDKEIERARNRVAMLGIELEGGWKKAPEGVSPNHDGSVRFPEQAVVNGLRYVGEIPSPPLPPRDLENWMKRYYPPFVNETCGMHVHMSFGANALAYTRLMAEAYPFTVVEYFIRWAKEQGLRDSHPIWERLSGNSRYCQHVYAADLQVMNNRKDFDQQRPGHRYTVINYNYGRTRTVECRLLPMMETVDLAISAVKHLVRVTNGFLLSTRTVDRKVRIKLHDDGVSNVREVVKVIV